MAAITALAASSRSGSARLLPMGRPAASMKVLAMPPPTMSWSTLSARLCRMVSLVDTLEPATMAARGAGAGPGPWSGRRSRPTATGQRTRWGRTARCRRWCLRRGGQCQRRRSQRCRTARPACGPALPCSSSRPHSRGSFPAAPPGRGPLVTPSTQLATSGTSRPSSSARRLATGASESSGLNSPSVGRPRWLVTMTAAPASRAMRMAESRRGCGCLR
jgi:hypothetical protein